MNAKLGPKPKLMECPFCGNPPVMEWRPRNPRASCVTNECWGAKLPAVSLDDPQQIAAWNKRVERERSTAEIERLRAELASERRWGDLWLFITNEEPLKFEKIVGEWTPRHWSDQAYKLMAAKRAAQR